MLDFTDVLLDSTVLVEDNTEKMDTDSLYDSLVDVTILKETCEERNDKVIYTWDSEEPTKILEFDSFVDFPYMPLSDISYKYRNGYISFQWKSPESVSKWIHIIPIKKLGGEETVVFSKGILKEARDNLNGANIPLDALVRNLSGVSVSKVIIVASKERSLKNFLSSVNLSDLLKNPLTCINVVTGATTLRYHISKLISDEDGDEFEIKIHSLVPVDLDVVGYRYSQDSIVFEVPFESKIHKGVTELESLQVPTNAHFELCIVGSRDSNIRLTEDRLLGLPIPTLLLNVFYGFGKEGSSDNGVL